MPPKKRAVASATEYEADKKAKVEVDDEEEELLKQIMNCYRGFLMTSINWTGGDDGLGFSRSKLTKVKAESIEDPDEEDEMLLISPKDDVSFPQDVLKKLRPKVIDLVNEIIKASNAWLEASNNMEQPISQGCVYIMLNGLHMNPEVTEDMVTDVEEGVCDGCIGFRRESGNRIGYRWDWEEAMDEEMKKGFATKQKEKNQSNYKPVPLVEATWEPDPECKSD